MRVRRAKRRLVLLPSSMTTSSGPFTETPSGRVTSFVVGAASAVQSSPFGAAHADLDLVFVESLVRTGWVAKHTAAL